MVGQFGFFLEFSGDFLNRVGGAQTVVVGIHDSLLVHHVNLAAELVFSADGDQNGGGVRTQLVVDVVQHVVEVGAGTVHLVHEAHAVMVIPRSRSCSIQSVVVEPSWVSPILWIMPV